MSWVSDVSYIAQQTAPATVLNNLKSNLDYLHSPNYAEYQHPGTGGDYTVSGTTPQDIDSTNFNLSITTTGGLVMSLFHGVFSVSSVGLGTVRANIVVADDVIAYRGRNLFTHTSVEINQATFGCCWFQYFVLPAGTHSFRAVWGASGVTGTLFVAARPFMGIYEV